MKHRSLEAERGFTLMEAVVAALLFALALLGLARLQGTMTLFAGDNRMRTQALNMAQQKWKTCASSLANLIMQPWPMAVTRLAAPMPALPAPGP